LLSLLYDIINSLGGEELKKIVMVFSFVSVIILSACSSLSNDQLIKDYVKDAHGIDIVVKDSYKNSLELGEDSYIVAPVDHQEMEFSVVVYDSPSEAEINYKSKYLIKDNYLNALEADTELHKLDQVIPNINKLGFKESFNDENRVFIGEVGGKKAIWTFFYSKSHMELASFEENDLDRLFELYKLIKQSGALFEMILISYMRDPHERVTFVFDMKKLKGVNTKEDFLLEMKKTNVGIASLYENKDVAFEAE